MPTLDNVTEALAAPGEKCFGPCWGPATRPGHKAEVINVSGSHKLKEARSKPKMDRNKPWEEKWEELEPLGAGGQEKHTA